METTAKQNRAKETVKTAEKRSLLKEVGMHNLVFTFVFACFLGTVIETFWCYLTRGYLESRKGLIYGPFNLIYGFGALLMLILLYNLSKNWVIFLGSALIGGAFEYLCSVFQEISFGTVSWHYVKETGVSINGRTSLPYMFFWGALGLLFMRVLFPALNNGLNVVFERVPFSTKRGLALGLSIFMVCNAAISFAAVARQAQRREGVLPQNTVEKYLDLTFNDERLQKIFPNMQLVTEKGTQNLWGQEEVKWWESDKTNATRNKQNTTK